MVCAFTGHRSHKLPWRGNEAAPDCVALRRVMLEQIERLIHLGVTAFLTGMAEGVDMWGAMHVVQLKSRYPEIRLIAVLPHMKQEENWPPQIQERYNKLLEAADVIVMLRQNFTDTCMMDRNRYMVDHADVLLAVTDGRRRSGASATVNMARRLKRHVVHIHPATRVVTADI